MAIPLVYNQEQLIQLCHLSPHPVRVVGDINAIAYPAAVRFVLAVERENTSGFAKPEEAAIIPVVYAVVFDANDVLDFYDAVAIRLQRNGIDGFEYAEADSTPTGDNTEFSTGNDKQSPAGE